MNVVGPAGVRVQAEKCPTCIFRPGNLMHLRTGRLRDLVKSVREVDGCIPCHDTLDGDEQAVCRGQFDEVKTSLLEVAERLDRIEWVTTTQTEGR